MNAKNLFIVTVIISLLAVGMASAQTVGDLQKEVRNLEFSGNNEEILKEKISAKSSEVFLLENEIYSLVAMKTPPEIMTLDAQGKISGLGVVFIGGFSGDYSAKSKMQTEKLYEDWKPTLSEKTSKEMLARIEKFLNQNGSYSIGEAKLAQQVDELINERSEDNGSETGIHVIELAELHNTIIDIRDELAKAHGDIDQKYADRFGPYIAIALLAIVVGFIVWIRKQP